MSGDRFMRRGSAGNPRPAQAPPEKTARLITPAELAALERSLDRRSHVPTGPVRGLVALYHHTAEELRACRAQLNAAASGGAASPADQGHRP